MIWWGPKISCPCPLHVSIHSLSASRVTEGSLCIFMLNLCSVASRGLFQCIRVDTPMFREGQTLLRPHYLHCINPVSFWKICLMKGGRSGPTSLLWLMFVLLSTTFSPPIFCCASIIPVVHPFLDI